MGTMTFEERLAGIHNALNRIIDILECGAKTSPTETIARIDTATAQAVAEQEVEMQEANKEKPKRGRKPKAEKAAKMEPAPAPQSAEEVSPEALFGGEPEAPKSPEPLTEESYKTQVLDYVKVLGLDIMQDCMTEYGVSKASLIPVEKRQSYLDKLAARAKANG